MRGLPTAACAVLLAACGEAPAESPDATVPERGAEVQAVGSAGAAGVARTTVGGGQDGAGAQDPLECLAENPNFEVIRQQADELPPATGYAEVPDAGGGPCPEGMVYVDTTYCPDIDRRCIDMEHEDINNLDICHAFARGGRCRVPARRIAFCIDRYEYPNRLGAHPTWMLDWYKAQATCESKGKRLCYASEWTAACEGPEHTPFPYGWVRDHDKCNIDNFFIEPKKWGRNGPLLFYSHDPKVALGELARLDQSVPSGAMDACQSGFGVHDMTGNVDEWVTSDVAPREKSLWSGLKGGAWGHVRSQCRPTTYSHDPSFAYYFVGFRCCSDAPGAPAWTASAEAMKPPPVEASDFAPEPVVVSDASGPSKSKFTRTGHAQ